MHCKALFEKIDELQEQYLNVLEDVCNIESPTSYKQGVDAVGEYFLNIAKQNNWQTEIFKQEISGNVVCITMNPDAKGKPICVSGHMDTVHPIGLFGTPAVRRDENNMYGPGGMDCKGGCVAALMAMDALNKCNFIARPVHLILQSDEENGSSTSNKETVKYMCKKAEEARAFINLEGSLEGTAVLQRKGILRYSFNIHGNALHSLRCADVTAANAVAEAACKIIELEKMKDADGTTCNCGVIHGGTVPNSVAEECNFFADIRFSTFEELENVKKRVEEISQTTYVAGCSCELKEISYRPAMSRTEKNVEFLNEMNKIFENNGLAVLEARSCLSGSDAAYITECGIPCVDNLGPEGKNIHSINEYIKLASLAESAKRIASVIYCI